MEYTPNFPRSLEDFKKFVSEHILNSDKIDDEICSSAIDKINRGDFQFTEQETETMRTISDLSDLGTICDCDDDHRIGEDGKHYRFFCFKNYRILQLLCTHNKRINIV